MSFHSKFLSSCSCSGMNQALKWGRRCTTSSTVALSLRPALSGTKLSHGCSPISRSSGACGFMPRAPGPSSPLGRRFVLQSDVQIDHLVPGNGGSRMPFEELEGQGPSLAGAQEQDRASSRSGRSGSARCGHRWGRGTGMAAPHRPGYAANKSRLLCSDRPRRGALRLDQPSLRHSPS